MTHQQVPRVGHLEITRPHQLRHGGLPHLKRLRGLKHRMNHGGYLGRPVVHGERRPRRLMALHHHNTLLGLNNLNDLHINRVYLSIRLLGNPLRQGGMELGTKEL